jgi:hypothetical protein
MKQITPEDIKNANISNAYKDALLEAYQNAREEDDGSFFTAACQAISYIIGLTSEIPTKLNGIDYDELVDKDLADWQEIDNRIVITILKEDEAKSTENIFQLSSWIFDRIYKLKNENFFEHVFQLLQQLGLFSSEKEAIMQMALSYSGFLINNYGQTSFGKVAFKYFDSLWEKAKEGESELLYNLYEILKKNDTSQFTKRRTSLLNDILDSGKNGRYYAIMATEIDDPEMALKLAREESDKKHRSTAYRICFYAKGDEKENYKEYLFSLYKKGTDNNTKSQIKDIWKDDSEKIIQLLGL